MDALQKGIHRVTIAKLKKFSIDDQLKYVKTCTQVEYIILDVQTAHDILKETEEAGFINRKPGKARIRTYADVIKRKAWNPLTGETIAWDIEIHDGKQYRVLTNGQHRVQAVSQGGNSIVVLRVIGVPRDSFADLDQGKTRTQVEMAQIHEWYKPEQTVPIAKLLLAYIKGGSPLCSIKKMSNPEIFMEMDVLADRKNLEKSVEHCWEYMQIAKKSYNIPYKCSGLLFFLWKQQDEVLVRALLKHLEAPNEYDMPNTPVFKYAINRLENAYEVDKAFVTGSRSNAEDYALKVLALAWSIHTKKIHSCLNEEDFIDIMNMYFYDKNPDEVELTTWNHIWEHSFEG